MTPYILIVMTWVGTAQTVSGGASTVITQEFTTHQTCTEAANQILDRWSGSMIHVMCVKK